MNSVHSHTWPAALATSPRRTTSGDLAAIAMHFNPCGYQAPRDNFIRFREHFHGCALFTCEVSFDGKFHLGADWRIHATPANLMWQKEQLVNWMVSRLPSAFRKVAWIDADLIFLNPDWAAETSALLDRFPVVQTFRAFQYLNAFGEIDRGVVSLGACQHGHPGGKHPGGAWAMRRELLQTHSLHAHNIVGGGDLYFVEAVTGQFTSGRGSTLASPRLQDHVTQWATRLHSDIRGQIGYVRGDVMHLFHGTRNNRQYIERTAILRDCDFDPDQDVRVGWNGLLEWSSDKPELHRRVAEYFGGRREDDPAEKFG